MKLCNYFTVTAFLAVLASITLFVSCEVVPSTPIDGPTVITGGNIEYGDIKTTWTQEEAIAKVKLALSHLSSQSQTLRSQYTDWETQLRADLNANNNDFVLSKITFANNVQANERNLYNTFQGYYFNTIKTRSSWYIAELVNKISSFENGSPNSLFNAQVKAFQLAHYLDTRSYLTDSDSASKQAEFETLAAEIERLGGNQRIPTNSLYGAIVVLENQLRIFLSRDYGPNRLGLVQQIEDYAQFDGWSDDLKALGFDLNNIPW
jgi:hypothetical protein